MRTLIRCIRSDIHKSRHTPMLWIHILIPLSAALLFAAYYSISTWEISAKISGYLEAVSYTHLDVYKRQDTNFVFPLNRVIALRVQARHE